MGSPADQSPGGGATGANLADVLSQLGRFDEAIGQAEAAVQIAQVADHPFSLYFGLFELGRAHLRRGDLPRATRVLERGLDHCRTRQVVIGIPHLAAALGAAYGPQGQRDHEANRLIKFARETRKSEAECTAILTLFGSHCTPPFDPKTDQKIATKIKKAYSRPPVFEPALLRPEGAEWAEGAEGAEEPPRLMTVAEVQARLGADVEWVVDGMFAVSDMSVLVSKAGVGKSTFAAQLAVSVAHGTPFLERQTRQGVVVLLAFEGARSTTSQMVRLGLDPADPNVLVWTAEGDPYGDPVAWLEKTLQAVTPIILIVDTLSDLIKIRHGASNAGYEEMTGKLGAVYSWVQGRRTHLLFIHHGGKGVREGIDTALGTVGIVSKPGTILDYRLLKPEEPGSPRVLKGVKHRAGGQVEVDLPAVVLDFDRERGLTVAGGREDVAVREIGLAIIKIVLATPGIRQSEMEEEVEGRKATKLEALRRLTHPLGGVLFKEGTAGSRTFPLRLKVRDDLMGDPVQIWRVRAGRFGPVSSQTPGTNSNSAQNMTEHDAGELVPPYSPTHGNQQEKHPEDFRYNGVPRVGSPVYIAEAREPVAEPPNEPDAELF